MSSSLAKPVALVATVQPLLLIWILAICFFVALAIVAVFSRGRRWYELGCMFLLIYVVMTTGSVVGTTVLADVRVVELEVIQTGQAR